MDEDIDIVTEEKAPAVIVLQEKVHKKRGRPRKNPLVAPNETMPQKGSIFAQPQDLSDQIIDQDYVQDIIGQFQDYADDKDKKKRIRKNQDDVELENKIDDNTDSKNDATFEPNGDDSSTKKKLGRPFKKRKKVADHAAATASATTSNTDAATTILHNDSFSIPLLPYTFIQDNYFYLLQPKIHGVDFKFEFFPDKKVAHVIGKVEGLQSLLPSFAENAHFTSTPQDTQVSVTLPSNAIMTRDYVEKVDTDNFVGFRILVQEANESFILE